MSLKEAEIKIGKFLESEAERVMVIRGSWGVGKTFFWNKMLFEYKNKLTSVGKYSYVSLFGVNEMGRVKNAIFENTIDKNIIGSQPTADTLLDNLGSYAKIYSKKIGSVGSKLIPRFVKEWLPEDMSVIQSLPFFTVNNVLICLDDFERKGDNLNSTNLLGLISDLKYQKNCKVVLIFNDEKLIEQDKKVYEELREKVVDREVYYDPTPNECAEIVFKTDVISEKIKILTNSLKIKNIRILQKIQELSNEIIPYLDKHPDDVQYTALNSLVLFCYCLNVTNESVPNLKQLREVDYGIFSSVILNEKDDGSADQNKWINMLSDYGYRKTDDFDLVILEGVNNGYFNKDKLVSEADKLSQVLAKNSSENSFRDSWDLYHHSFDMNEEDVIQSIYSATKSSINSLFCNSINSVVVTFRKLGRDNLADELIDLFILERSSLPDLFDTTNLEIFPGSEVDPVLNAKFSAVYASSLQPKSIEIILMEYAKNSSYSESDINHLKSCSIDQLYQVFKSNQGDDLRKLIKTSLHLIPTITKEALLKIAAESTLNRLRVSQYVQVT